MLVRAYQALLARHLSVEDQRELVKASWPSSPKYLIERNSTSTRAT